MSPARNGVMIQHLIAEISAATASFYATIAGVAGASIAAVIALMRTRDGNKASTRQARISANSLAMNQLSQRIGALEAICTNQQKEIADLHAQLLELARENARLNEENRHLRNAQEMVESVRKEKHDVAQMAAAYSLTIVYLKNEINRMLELSGKPPRFKHPNQPDLEIENAAPSHPV